MRALKRLGSKTRVFHVRRRSKDPRLPTETAGSEAMGVEGTGEVGEPDTSEGLKYPGDGAPPGPGSKRVSSR